MTITISCAAAGLVEIVRGAIGSQGTFLRGSDDEHQLRPLCSSTLLPFFALQTSCSSRLRLHLGLHPPLLSSHLTLAGEPSKRSPSFEMAILGHQARWHIRKPQYGSRRLAAKNHLVAALGEVSYQD